jgi:hypothetical protein
MRSKVKSHLRGIAAVMISLFPLLLQGQIEKQFADKYLKKLPGSFRASSGIVKYNMSAIYVNRDLYGNFTTKTMITGDYTRGFEGDTASWNNVYIAVSPDYSGSFGTGTKQSYMENFRYVPSEDTLKAEPFRNFPSNPDNILSRNLIWDMYSLEIYAWKYLDSLKLNKPYLVKDIGGQFNMAEIGKYTHYRIFVTWKGITEMNGNLCAVIDFTADDNIVEISMPQVSTRGTEQYWGTVILSLGTKLIEHAEMYSGTIQEIEVKGMKDKFLAKTIRELVVEKIR